MCVQFQDEIGPDELNEKPLEYIDELYDMTRNIGKEVCLFLRTYRDVSVVSRTTYSKFENFILTIVV